MCTLVLASRWYAGWPLVVATNRDENLERDSAPPTLQRRGDVELLAPTDLVAGGMWLGLNASKVFVGITNRFGAPHDPRRPSRGDLVARALRHPSASSAFEDLSRIDAAQQNGFHLVMADAESAFLVRGDGERLVTAVLPPGEHVVTERSFGAAPTMREALLRARLGSERGAPGPSDHALADLLSERAMRPFEGVLVELPEQNYGTRSSSIVRLGADDVRFLHAHGPPDVTPFEDLSALARALVGQTRVG